jgi:hypothetical protein
MWAIYKLFLVRVAILCIWADEKKRMGRNAYNKQGRREELRAGGGYFQKWEKDVVQSNSGWE